MKNANAALGTVIHTYPDVLICIRKYDCPSKPRTRCSVCAFHGLGPGTGAVVEWRDEVAHGQALRLICIKQQDGAWTSPGTSVCINQLRFSSVNVCAQVGHFKNPQHQYCFCLETSLGSQQNRSLLL